MGEHFDADHIHTTPEGRHFRHGDGMEVDGDGAPLGGRYEINDDGFEYSHSAYHTDRAVCEQEALERLSQARLDGAI